MGGAPSAEGSSDEEVDTLGLYKQIIELLKPGETLTKVCVWSVWVCVCGVCGCAWGCGRVCTVELLRNTTDKLFVLESLFSRMRI